MLSPAFSHPFPPFRDASAGRCSYNLTLQHCFAAISKVCLPARPCDLSCDLSCDRYLLTFPCRLFILVFLTFPTSILKSTNTLKKLKMATSTGSYQVPNAELLNNFLQICSIFTTANFDAAHFSHSRGNCPCMIFAWWPSPPVVWHDGLE